MLRFFSRRKPRGRAEQKGYYQQQQLEKEKANEGQKNRKRNKNLLPCRIILLDGSDLSIDISVRKRFLGLFWNDFEEIGNIFWSLLRIDTKWSESD